MAANEVNLDQVALYRGYLGTKSSMYYVEIYCYKNCSTVKLYKTQKMAVNQVNFMKHVFSIVLSIFIKDDIFFLIVKQVLINFFKY